MLGFLPRRSTKVLHGGGVLNCVFKTMDGMDGTSLKTSTEVDTLWISESNLYILQIQVTQNHQGDGGHPP